MPYSMVMTSQLKFTINDYHFVWKHALMSPYDGVIQCGAVISWQLSPKSSQPTLHNSPVRARYVVSFVSSVSDLCSATVIAVLYVISWYIRPRYNDTRLYYYFTYRLPFYSWVSFCRTNHFISKAYFTVCEGHQHTQQFDVYLTNISKFPVVVLQHIQAGCHDATAGPWYHVCHISVLMSYISAGV